MLLGSAMYLLSSFFYRLAYFKSIYEIAKINQIRDEKATF
jgi:hypothetical protein